MSATRLVASALVERGEELVLLLLGAQERAVGIERQHLLTQPVGGAAERGRGGMLPGGGLSGRLRTAHKH